MRVSVRVVLLGLIAVTVLLAAPSASAQGVYLGGSYSSVAADIVDNEIAGAFDDSSDGYKLFLGYEFMPYLGIEGAWVDLGLYNIDPAVLYYLGGYTSGAVEADGYNVSVIGNIPIGRAVTLFGRAGYFFWNARLTGDARLLADAAAIGVLLSESGEDPMFGAGLRVNFGKFSIQGEWEMYDSDYVEADVYSIGVRYRF